MILCKEIRSEEIFFLCFYIFFYLFYLLYPSTITTGKTIGGLSVAEFGSVTVGCVFISFIIRVLNANAGRH